MRTDARKKLLSIIQDCIPELQDLETIDSQGARAWPDNFLCEAKLNGKSVLLAAMLSCKASAERLQGTLARLSMELGALNIEKDILNHS